MTKYHNNYYTTRVSGGGVSFCGVLAIVFITLKLLKVIDWSWVWVLAPIWIPAALAATGIAIYLLVLAIILIVHKIKNKRASKRIRSYYKNMFEDEEKE